MVIPSGPVHFIWLGGDWCPQYERAIFTARVHEAPIILWTAKHEKWNLPYTIEIREFDLPDELRDHPIQKANVKDLFAWRTLYEHGGLYLDLDTISLKPVWDLLTRDVLVSREWPPGEELTEHHYNSAVVCAHRKSVVLRELADRAQEILDSGESRWGKTGPHLLTEVVAQHQGAFDIADYGFLSGWNDGTIGAYYEGARPEADVRVIHLYSSSNMERFRADNWWPS